MHLPAPHHDIFDLRALTLEQADYLASLPYGILALRAKKSLKAE